MFMVLSFSYSYTLSLYVKNMVFSLSYTNTLPLYVKKKQKEQFFLLSRPAN